MRNAVIGLFIGIILGSICAGTSRAQAVDDNFANNNTSVEWGEVNTEHFKIVFATSEQSKIPQLSKTAEQIYREFKTRMGTAPDDITIYFKNERATVSGIRARKTDDEFSIWEGDERWSRRFVPGEDTALQALRQEIAYVFQQHVQYFPVDYYYYLFSRPEKTPWSDGFTSFMAAPSKTALDAEAENEFASENLQYVTPEVADSIEIMQGRSQIHYFLDQYGGRAFETLYSRRQSLLGLIPYFDFNASFEDATGISYDAFTRQWWSGLETRTQPGLTQQTVSSQHNEITVQADTSMTPATAYHAFSNIQWEQPFAVPYYISSGDFGLAAYLSLSEPMHTHQFRYYGSISFADPIGKSFFYSKYTNNSFRPRLELTFNRFPSASGFFGKSRKVKMANIIALESLWKLTGLSQGSSQWYAGLTLRHMGFNYFPEASLRLHHPDLFYNNTKTRQTDLKALLTWRSFTAGRNALIHPLDGEGVRFSVTGSDKILGSKARYLRFNLDGYTIWPGFSDHRIFLYANAVTDVGEPAGRDFLSFSNNGHYQLPGPDFTGSVNPGYDQFVRGYTTNLVGARFVFGSLEYRIPLFFDTRRKLLGFIPPARTSVTLFADAGVMGNARVAANKTLTKHRYSIGTEVKRVFSIGGGFELTYEVGIAQPLTQSFGPNPYVNIKTAIPF